MLRKTSLCVLPVLLALLTSCILQHKKEVAENDEGIPVASLADVNMDASVINKIDTAIRNGTYPGIERETERERKEKGKRKKHGYSLCFSALSFH